MFLKRWIYDKARQCISIVRKYNQETVWNWYQLNVNANSVKFDVYSYNEYGCTAILALKFCASPYEFLFYMNIWEIVVMLMSRVSFLLVVLTVWGTKIKRQHGIWLQVQRYLKSCLVVNCEMWYGFFAGWIFSLFLIILITFDPHFRSVSSIYYTRIKYIRLCGI